MWENSSRGACTKRTDGKNTLHTTGHFNFSSRQVNTNESKDNNAR